MKNVINLSSNQIEYVTKTNMLYYVVPDVPKYHLDCNQKIAGRERFYVTDEASLSTLFKENILNRENIVFEFSDSSEDVYSRCLEANRLPLSCCRFFFEVSNRMVMQLHEVTSDMILNMGIKLPLTVPSLFEPIKYPEDFVNWSYEGQKHYYSTVIKEMYSFENQLKLSFKNYWGQKLNKSNEFSWDKNPFVIIYELKRLPISSILNDNDVPILFEDIDSTYNNQLYLWDMTKNTVISGLNGCNSKFYDDNYKNYEKQFRFVTIEGIKIYDYNKYGIEWLLFNDKPEI